MEVANIRNSIGQQIKQQGPESTTADWMRDRRGLLEDLWSGELDVMPTQTGILSRQRVR